MSEENVEAIKIENADLKINIKRLEEQIDNLNITVEIINDRWIKSVNENLQVELELRKMKKALMSGLSGNGE